MLTTRTDGFNPLVSQFNNILEKLVKSEPNIDIVNNDSIVHSLSSGKVEMFLCATCHAFTPHVNVWKR